MHRSQICHRKRVFMPVSSEDLSFGSFAVRVTPPSRLLLQSRSLSAPRLARLPAVTPRASAPSRPARRYWSRLSPSLHGSRAGVLVHFGFHAAHGSFWANTGFFFNHLNETNTTSLLIGGVALALLMLGKIFLKHKPVALFVVIGGIIAAARMKWKPVTRWCNF